MNLCNVEERDILKVVRMKAAYIPRQAGVNSGFATAEGEPASPAS